MGEAVDAPYITGPVREMMDETDRCLCCGANLKYHRKKQKRRNNGYCCLDCYYQKPPKMAYIEHECARDARGVILDFLNHNDNVKKTAELLGVRKQTLYRWLDKLNIERIVKWR